MTRLIRGPLEYRMTDKLTTEETLCQIEVHVPFEWACEMSKGQGMIAGASATGGAYMVGITLHCTYCHDSYAPLPRLVGQPCRVCATGIYQFQLGIVSREERMNISQDNIDAFPN